MPARVYNNVADHRLLDGGVVVEDVTKVGLPTITHPTSTISVSGMAMDVDMPNATHVNAMECTITHNDGLNAEILSTPGKHTLELRVARQVYTTATAESSHESVKYRIVGLWKETQNGDIETGSPIGKTEKYSILRYEEEVNGKVTVLIDAMNGTLRHNGVDYTDEVQNLLK